MRWTTTFRCRNGSPTSRSSCRSRTFSRFRDAARWSRDASSAGSAKWARKWRSWDSGRRGRRWSRAWKCSRSCWTKGAPGTTWGCCCAGWTRTMWSAGQVIYNGSYVPLKGISMSEAFKSTLDISFDVRGGLIMRQIHHWAALLFTVAITVHMFRVFFTGAFRKPREINWVIGTILSLLAINEGFTGYSLPDDLLSGTGLRAAEGFIQSV